MASALHYLRSKANKETVMNIKAIIASLVLGSSSLAVAAPAVTVVRDHRDPVEAPVAAQVYVRPAQPVYTPAQPVYTPAQPVYTRPAVQPVAYPRPAAQDPRWRAPVAYRPVTLASGLRFANLDRATINVGRQAGLFGSLQISATSGSNLIKLVNIVFADGSHQTVRNVDRTLIGNQSMTLDLDGDRRAIRSITVYGRDLNNGWRRSVGSFTVTAA